ncbi:ATP-binding protein [Spirosoma luteolum]
MDLPALLRQIPALADVPADQLQWVADQATEHQYEAGAVLANIGDPADHLFFLLDGRIVIDSGQNGPDDDIAVYEPTGLLGVLPFSRMNRIQSRLLVERPSHLLRLHRDQLRPLVQAHYELTEALVQQMTTRVRDFTRFTQQEDKMASLGRLSAGLAHELNNPVAAIVRSADTLRRHLGATPDTVKRLMRMTLTDEQIDGVTALLFKKFGQKAPTLSMLARSRSEDELTDWLDDNNMADCSLDLTSPLVDFGYTAHDLEELRQCVGEENVPGVITWIVDNLVTERLVVDISDASGRIDTLVSSIKNYTHMDRGAGKTLVPLGEGIRSTVTLLDHKIRQKHIIMTLDLPDDLPAVCGWPGELNQLWTNLIDNAIDAVADGGTITIRSAVDHQANGLDFVLTHVIDNGSGIPDAIKGNIFDPFFTTKEIGKGTGLGLDIVQGIVRHHNGSINVHSQPGHTDFSVCLPI